MFLTRHCTKLSSPARVFLSNKLSLKEKYFGLSYSCQCHNTQTSRLFASTALVQNAARGSDSSKRLQFSPKTLQSNSSETALKPNKPSANDLLEKLIAGLSTDIHNKNRVYKNDLVRVIKKVEEMNFSTKKQGLLLIRCCTEMMPDETPATRMALVEIIWNAIKPHTEFEVEHYNELLKVYIANNRTLTVSTFIQQMAPAKPNVTTYELILRALAEAGDLNQSTEVISNMKSQNLPANENIFNSLIICQGKAGNPQNIQEVLTMMKSLKLEKSIDTYTAVARALAWNKRTPNLLEEMENARSRGLEFGETHIMEIVKTLASIGLYGSIPKVLQFLPDEILKTPSISPYMQSVCTLLVFQNHPLAALEIYKCLPLPSFGPKDDQGLHGRSLVRDCVKAAMPSSVIALVTQELMSSGRNPIALHNASEAALQLGKVPLALDMFTRMQQLGLPIRPHYFWPILLHNSRSYGEKGIMNTLKTMVTMDVKPDYETIMEYTLPYVSFTSPQNLMKKFLDTGLTVSTVLTPMMDTLLKTGQVRAASEICELFEGKIDADKLLKPLLRGYLMSGDVKSTVYILEDILKKATDNNKDWVGRFLCVFMQHKKVVEDLTEFMDLAKAIKAARLKISTSASDYCMSRLPEKHSREASAAFRDILVEVTDDRLVDEGDLFAQQMPHPKQMNEESLRAHLNELEAKGMNTRGVLRKLLQQYCRDGNLAEARKIAEKCQKEGVFLSAGMKAAIFDLHVKLGELDLAEIALADLNKTSPNFTLDEFKVIDFATLMVYRKKIEQAFELINEQSKKRRIVGGRSIAMNCWRLLDATAAHGTHLETIKMFDMLTSLRYCKPSNVLLGPLIRVHLKNDNLQEAVNEFVRLASKYSKTPLKHELLSQIMAKMGEGHSEEKFLVNEKSNGRFNKMAQTVLNIDKKVHGASDVQLTLIAALAEVGYKKTLRKLFLDPSVTFHPDALLRRCERFADERKVKPLETIAECANGVRRVPVQEVYDLMLDVYQREDDAQGALSLWTKMQESDAIPSQKFVSSICSMLKANHKPIPSDLLALLDKQDKKASVEI
ncbi:leucine-rich PPR motif-containing protein, mitochondrial-like isoform X1 [Ostrinia furnacalis]|uniref:leucine-rich PPR motif-containing protein, mitochondrial-like isoform X1 n=1 Tax=Ostrinia furnacalis TaxID=93504 RepID=UPI00103B3671|nr:leucine-rich PPR motif-containing protein, mitochondrial-like isoform X1 [Ostrinia furnacalis]